MKCLRSAQLCDRFNFHLRCFLTISTAVLATMLFNANPAFGQPQAADTPGRGSATPVRSPIPGEMVRTPLGETKRVWSTSGAVQTQQPAISQGAAGVQSIPGAAVIVDERGRPSGEPNRPRRPGARIPELSVGDRFDLRD